VSAFASCKSASAMEGVALDQRAIVRQVEHYFSHQNLASDQFLRAHMAASASGTAVPLAVIASFPRCFAFLVLCLRVHSGRAEQRRVAA